MFKQNMHIQWGFDIILQLQLYAGTTLKYKSFAWNAEELLILLSVASSAQQLVLSALLRSELYTSKFLPWFLSVQCVSIIG